MGLRQCFTGHGRTSMLILYSLPFSNYSAKVAIALNVKGIDHEKRPPPGGYSSPEYMSIVPSGTVPGMDDDGVILSESDVINEYLEEKWPNPPLLHGDAELRGKQRYLSRFHDFMVEPNLRALFSHLVPAQRGSAFVNDKLDSFNHQVGRLENFIDPKPYLLTEEFGFADCAYPATFLLADLMFDVFGRKPEFGAKISRWREHVDVHPAVAPVLEISEATTREWLDGVTGGS